MCAVIKSDLFEESLSWLYIHIPLPYYVHTCTSHKEHVSLIRVCKDLKSSFQRRGLKSDLFEI